MALVHFKQADFDAAVNAAIERRKQREQQEG